jgi:predicted amidohydrolase YtcJ
MIMGRRCFLLAPMFLALLPWSALAGEPLKVGVFAADASPPVGSPMAYDPTNEVLLPLSCRGVVLLGKGEPIVLCALDWLGIGNDGQAEFRRVLADAAGTTPTRVAVHTLHQHDAPHCDFSADRMLAAQGINREIFDATFARRVLAQAAVAVREAIPKARAVSHIGLGQAEVETVASNRRILGPDGKVKYVRYTSCKDPIIRDQPVGTVDPMVKLISFWDGDTPIVALTYFATHPQSYYRTGKANPDFPGMARDRRQQSTGVPHIHFDGAGGNIGAGKWNDGSPANRQVLADRVANGMQRALETTRKVPVTASELAWKSVPVALPPATHLDAARLRAVLENKTAKVRDRAKAANDLAWLLRCGSGDTIDVSCLQLGPARVLHLPGELFVEYQLAAQSLRPDLFVAMAAYGDYGPGYIGTEAAYPQGGYECQPSSSLVAPAVEHVLMTAIRTLLDRAEASATADLVLHHGKVVTVDRGFAIAEALAVKDGRLLHVGTNEEALAARGPATEVIDLAGKMVLPGLIDSHVHPGAASMTEFDHPGPEMETVQDVLNYVRERAEALGPDKWIAVRQVFITRLQEQRYPTREELDRAAPHNPVLFATGPDASLNTQAMKLSGIDKDFLPEGPGKVEKDPQTGEPTGILRNLTRYVKVSPSERKPTEADEDGRLLELLRDYSSVGLTSIIDRDAEPSEIERYARLHRAGGLPVRVGISHHIEHLGPLEAILSEIRRVGAHPLRQGGPRLRIVGIKSYLDGGMLTGSASMREPWGVSKIYAIDDPTYRGVRFIPHDRLVPMVRAAVESGLQYTAHSVGDGAVHALLDAYEEVNRNVPIASTRPCITHSNFMSREAIDQAARLAVAVDIQPAWLYLDTRTLFAQFGNDRLRFFQPLRSLFAAGVTAGGGSDHMQKIGSLRAINPYNPFLGMWIAVSRRAKGFEGRLHPEEALTREQAIRFYTINNARLLFLEDRIGSLEEGKLADLAIVDRDLLTCPEDEIRSARVLATYVDGKRVFPQTD